MFIPINQQSFHSSTGKNLSFKRFASKWAAKKRICISFRDNLGFIFIFSMTLSLSRLSRAAMIRFVYFKVCIVPLYQLKIQNKYREKWVILIASRKFSEKSVLFGRKKKNQNSLGAISISIKKFNRIITNIFGGK